ncbi:glycosyltransferase family 4 protein [Synechococcus sp. 1G10]|uniref:glycosyltransferase family 4 protein n=1 Tax=Synechococcus sp. 1G10 TaxID=2025605 RepID=UPI001303A8BB|nr:glycosyltransferase family 4 protein [Synechococcus sp. 1G10]
MGVCPLLVIYATPASPGAEVDDELGFPPQWDHLAPQTYPCRTLEAAGPLAILRLAWQLRRCRPALVVICGYFPRSQLLLAVLLRLLGQRIGLRSDNTLSHTHFTGIRGRLRRLGVGWIQRLFHVWHPVGEQAQAYLRTLSGIERPSYRFAYAVDNDWFAWQSEAARADRASFLAQRQWPAEAFVVLGIMKWTHREDPLTLVFAFQQLLSQCPSARLILVGDGPLRVAVHEAIAPLGAAVHTPGYVAYSQLPIWYGRADVFVHPAPDEPWGVSVQEALACGLPVLAATGVGAAAEVITSGENGSVFTSGEAPELTALLAAMARDPEALAKQKPACQGAADHWHYRHTIAAFQRALAEC